MSRADGIITWVDVENTAVLEYGESQFDPIGFANLTDAQKQLILDEAFDIVIFSRWNTLCFDGRRYYCAHKGMLAVTAAAGQGTTGSENIGSVSVSSTLAVNNPTAEQGFLETHFGRQYYNLRQTIIRRNQRGRVY